MRATEKVIDTMAIQIFSPPDDASERPVDVSKFWPANLAGNSPTEVHGSVHDWTHTNKSDELYPTSLIVRMARKIMGDDVFIARGTNCTEDLFAMLRRYGVEFTQLAYGNTIFAFDHTDDMHEESVFGLNQGAVEFTWKGTRFKVCKFIRVDTFSETMTLFGSTSLYALRDLANDLRRFQPSHEGKIMVYQGNWDYNTEMKNDIAGLSWDDLVLPSFVKDDIRSNAEHFFTGGGDIYRRLGISYKRGFLLVGDPGCHAAGTHVLMSDGALKAVEDVHVGDNLMGPDSKPREVFELFRGEDEMYEITPVRGEPFVVNQHHILNLERGGRTTDNANFPDTVNITVKDFLSLSTARRSKLNLHHVGVDYSNSEWLPVDPYFLGVWLGNGHSRTTAVISAAEEITACLYEQSTAYGLYVRVVKDKEDAASSHYFLASENDNGLLSAMQDIGVIENKHIPLKYQTASRSERFSLLAGFIDAQGNLIEAERNLIEAEENVVASDLTNVEASDLTNIKVGKAHYEIVTQSERLAQDIRRLALGLGLCCRIREITKVVKSLNFPRTLYRITLGGDIDQIPVRIPRKKSPKALQHKGPRRTGIANVAPLGVGEYYGFNISGDHLYLTEDHFVHHNSGKSMTGKIIAATMNIPFIYVLSVQNQRGDAKAGIQEVFEQARENSPCVILFEDLDSQIDDGCRTVFLNALDGFKANDGVLTIATTNYPDRIDLALTDRPSRFDRKWIFPNPDVEYRAIYLTSRLKRLTDTGTLTDEVVSAIVTAAAVTEGYSYAHLQELVVTAGYPWIASGCTISLADEIAKAVLITREQVSLGSGDKLATKMRDRERKVGLRK